MMSSAPAFSVILPTYSRPDLLRRSISSVLAQDFRDFELVIVDDASPGGIDAVAAVFDDRRVRYLRHEENRGVGAARNTGIEASSGELVSLLDDDDEYEPDFLSHTYRTLSAAPPDVGFSWCGVRWIRDLPDGRSEVDREEIWNPNYPDKQSAYLGFLANRRVGTNCGLTFRRQVFEGIGAFDEDFPGGAEDTDLLVRAVREFRFTVVPLPLVRLHLHGRAHLRRAGSARAEGYDRLIEKHRETLEEHRALWVNLHYKAAWLHYHAGNRRKGRANLLRALSRQPLHPRSLFALFLFEGLGGWGPALHRNLSSLRRRRPPLI